MKNFRHPNRRENKKYRNVKDDGRRHFKMPELPRLLSCPRIAIATAHGIQFIPVSSE